MTLVGRLLLLLAVLFMPLGMTPAAASASPVDHHQMMAGMAMEHCPDRSNDHGQDGGLAMCSMACASALPAQEMARDEAPLRHRQLLVPMMTQRLRGILLEIATPPPKFA
ncbi:MAG TPA: hypothetical protein VNR86_01460 [Sphingomicrobium sp.]|nr:hypothetical protein [Sphingomicrobium sp.]